MVAPAPCLAYPSSSSLLWLPVCLDQRSVPLLRTSSPRSVLRDAHRADEFSLIAAYCACFVWLHLATAGWADCVFPLSDLDPAFKRASFLLSVPLSVGFSSSAASSAQTRPGDTAGAGGSALKRCRGGTARGVLSGMEWGGEREGGRGEAFEEERIPKPPREGREDEQFC